MTHPVLKQLRFARSEFARVLEGVSEEDARKRLMPMNCLSWMVGHLASQEQFYFVWFPQGKVIDPELIELVGFGKPGTTPPLAEMWEVYNKIIPVADEFLATVTDDDLDTYLEQSTKGLKEAGFGTISDEVLARKSVKNPESIGTRMYRTMFHYFFHTGEAHAVRQQLGHPDLPYFVGGMPDDLYLYHDLPE